MKQLQDDFLETVADYFFTLLPFIVLVIVFLYKNDLTEMIYISEWSFASAIINGQLIVKLVKKNLQISQTTQKRRPAMGRITLLFSFLIVVLFVPSLILLALVVINDSPSIALAISQIALFIVSSIFYFVINQIFSDIQDEIDETENSKRNK